MKAKQLRVLWDRFFEYDRVAERKIIRSIRLWNSNSIVKQAHAMFLYNKIRKQYGCSINPRIQLGDNFYISHAQDIVIGQTSIIGNDCRVYPGAKVIARVEGDLDLVAAGKRRHPLIGDGCLLGADCIVMGPITIGNNVTIAAGAIVTKDVPDNCVVYGINQIKVK